MISFHPNLASRKYLDRCTNVNLDQDVGGPSGTEVVEVSMSDAVHPTFQVPLELVAEEDPRAVDLPPQVLPRRQSRQGSPGHQFECRGLRVKTDAYRGPFKTALSWWFVIPGYLVLRCFDF